MTALATTQANCLKDAGADQLAREWGNHAYRAGYFEGTIRTAIIRLECGHTDAAMEALCAAITKLEEARNHA